MKNQALCTGESLLGWDLDLCLSTKGADRRVLFSVRRQGKKLVHTKIGTQRPLVSCPYIIGFLSPDRSCLSAPEVCPVPVHSADKGGDGARNVLFCWDSDVLPVLALQERFGEESADSDIGGNTYFKKWLKQEMSEERGPSMLCPSCFLSLHLFSCEHTTYSSEYSEEILCRSLGLSFVDFSSLVYY